MKKNLTVILFIISCCANSQVFTGSGGPIQNMGQETYFNLSVLGLSQAQLDNTFGVEEVCIQIIHPAVEELSVFLQSPSGTKVELTDGHSCKGANYTSTCLNASAATSITLATAPYAGTYKPTGFFGRFHNGQAGNGTWKLIIKDYLAFVNSGNLINWSIKFGTAPVPSMSFTSSDLPIVVINTNTQSISDFKILADMGIIYNGVGVRNYMTDPLNNYNGKARIRLRGHSSKNFAKKPYAVETSDAAGIDLPVSLLGMPEESEWALLAMYQDKSLLRIPLTYELSRQMGHYAARSKYVELVINNEYQGVYALVEKIKRDSCRVDISKLTPLENTSPGITGGYIFKIDRADEPGWTSLLAGDASNNAHFFYQYVYPSDSDITVPQKDYIKSFVDSFETTMSAPYFANPWIGYQKYIAGASFIDYFIINELSKNVDAYRLSTYLYKNNISKGGKLHIGPVWDYDLAWHNCNYGNTFDPNGWQYQVADLTYPTPVWWKQFMTDTTFTNSLYCRWTQLRQGALSDANIYSLVDGYALALNESQQRNFTQWPILGAYISPNPQNQAGATYQSEVNDLKTWLGSRLGWLDWAIQGHCPIIGIEENSFDKIVSVYPNPSNGLFNVQCLMANGDPLVMNDEALTISIYNVLGENVFTSLLNDQTLAINLTSQPQGIYSWQIRSGHMLKAGKVIIQ